MCRAGDAASCRHGARSRRSQNRTEFAIDRGLARRSRFVSGVPKASISFQRPEIQLLILLIIVVDHETRLPKKALTQVLNLPSIANKLSSLLSAAIFCHSTPLTTFRRGWGCP